SGRLLFAASDAIHGTELWSVLVGQPWYNPVNPLDVDGDDRVAPIDALLILNRLNLHLGGPVPLDANAGPLFYDTSDDGNVSPIDVLLVLTYLNSHPGGEGEANAAADDFSGLIDLLAADAMTPARRRRI